MPNIRRAVCAGAVLVAVLAPGAVAQAAPQPAPGPATVAVAHRQAPARAADNSDQNTGQRDSGNNNGLWGLLGLVGLAGLAGLLRRGPKPGAMAGYPQSAGMDPGEPPLGNRVERPRT